MTPSPDDLPADQAAVRGCTGCDMWYPYPRYRLDVCAECGALLGPIRQRRELGEQLALFAAGQLARKWPRPRRSKRWPS